MKPQQRTFDDPTRHAKTTAVFCVAFGQQRCDAALQQLDAMGLRIIAPVSLDPFGAIPWTPAFASDRRYGIDQRQQLRDIMAIGAGRRLSFGSWFAKSNGALPEKAENVQTGWRSDYEASSGIVG